MRTGHRRRRHLGAGIAGLVAAAGVVVLPAPAARAQTDPETLKLPPAGAVVTDARVDDIATFGGRAYLKGGFAHAGRYSGPSALLDPASGAVDPVSARLNGHVSDAVADGAGGFFVAGDFSLAGDVPHANVVHLRSDGFVDGSFTAATDGAVYALALDAGRLYLGGDFTTVGGQPHARVAVVDAGTGAPLPFAAAAPARVTELALDPAAADHPARLYVGSLASPLQGVDAATGAPLAGFSSPGTTTVRALAVGGGRLYVGNLGVVALDAATGAPVPGFAPTFTPDPDPATAAKSIVHALLLDGGRLYAGGSFGAAFGGSGRSLVVLDPISGVTDAGFRASLTAERIPEDRFISGPGRPDKELDTGVFDLVRRDGRLWAGGRFTAAGGPQGANLAALDPASGALLGVRPPYLDGQVNALAATPDGRLFAGGNFALAGARAVSALAKVDPRTLAVDPVFGDAGPHELGSGYQASFLAGPTQLFDVPLVGDNYGAEVPRFQATALQVRTANATTGRMTRWAGAVRNLTGFTLSGRDVMIARRLENRPGFPRNVIEVRDAATGRVKRSFRVPLRGYIHTLTLSRGSLYVAGSFRRKRPSGQQANLAVLRLDPRTGRMDDGFDPHAHGPVQQVTPIGGVLRLDGFFDKIQGRRSPGGTAFVEPLGGFLRPSPAARAGGTTQTVAGRRLVARELFDVRTGGEDRGTLFFVVSVPAR